MAKAKWTDFFTKRIKMGCGAVVYFPKNGRGVWYTYEEPKMFLAVGEPCSCCFEIVSTRDAQGAVKSALAQQAAGTENYQFAPYIGRDGNPIFVDIVDNTPRQFKAILAELDNVKARNKAKKARKARGRGKK